MQFIGVNKVSRIKIVVFTAALIIVSVITIRIQFFPFGYGAERLLPDTTRLEQYRISHDIPNTSIYSYKVDVKISNKSEFVDFLKVNATTYKTGTYTDIPKYELGSFMDANGSVNWQNVLEAIEVRMLGWEKIYTLKYKTLYPGCNGYRLDMTNDGYIRDYRSAGK